MRSLDVKSTEVNTEKGLKTRASAESASYGRTSRSSFFRAPTRVPTTDLSEGVARELLFSGCVTVELLF